MKDKDLNALAEILFAKLRDNQVQQVSASNSTLFAMIKDLTKEVKENTTLTLETKTHLEYITEKVDSIEKQTIKTNGRVNVLEEKQNTQSGLVKAIIVVAPIVITLISYIFNNAVNQLTEYGHENRQYINELKEKIK